MLLISHFYNEEFLLPHWIKHHKHMFDHAVMIDYGSRDMSVDIIRELAPEWEIRPTKNNFFEEPAIGNEVEDVEKEFQGWKIALNTTEFLMCADGHLKDYVNRVRRPMRTTGVIVVDRPHERSIVTDDEPLVLQKTFGYMESDVMRKESTTKLKILSRSRLLHDKPSGMYGPGRHSNRVTRETDPDLVICWFGWAPFDFVKSRKMQIQHKVSARQKRKERWADLYCVDDQKLEDMYEHEWKRSYDLLENPIYKKVHDAYKETYDRRMYCDLS